MKKLVIAFVCSIGVGLGMMACPAQECDDNITMDAKNKNTVQTKVSERKNASLCFASSRAAGAVPASD